MESCFVLADYFWGLFLSEADKLADTPLETADFAFSSRYQSQKIKGGTLCSSSLPRARDLAWFEPENIFPVLPHSP